MSSTACSGLDCFILTIIVIFWADTVLLAADWPLMTPIQVQANVTNADDTSFISGQYSTGVNTSTSNASFTELLLHAPHGAYNITFDTSGSAVSCNFFCNTLRPD